MKIGSITVNENVYNQLAARGVDEKTGVYGSHSVRIGTGPRIDLSKIKSKEMWFAGFRSVSTLSGALTQSVQKSVSLMASSTGSSAQALLESLRTDAKYTELVSKKTGAAISAREDYASAVKGLPMAKVVALYKNLKSAEMDLLSTSLQSEVALAEGKGGKAGRDAKIVLSRLQDLMAVVADAAQGVKDGSQDACADSATCSARQRAGVLESLARIDEEALARPAFKAAMKDLHRREVELFKAVTAEYGLTGVDVDFLRDPAVIAARAATRHEIRDAFHRAEGAISVDGAKIFVSNLVDEQFETIRKAAQEKADAMKGFEADPSTTATNYDLVRLDHSFQRWVASTSIRTREQFADVARLGEELSEALPKSTDVKTTLRTALAQCDMRHHSRALATITAHTLYTGDSSTRRSLMRGLQACLKDLDAQRQQTGRDDKPLRTLAESLLGFLKSDTSRAGAFNYFADKAPRV